MTFPTGYVASYVVPNSGLNHTLDRVSQINLVNGLSFVTVATYQYLGLASVVGTTLPEPDVYSNRFDGTGDYVELDRWNRYAGWSWTKDLATDVDFYDVSLGFNARGDITSIIDHVMQTAGTTTGEFDRLYELDDLGRLLGMERGHLSGGSITTPEEDRDWTLTATGNWASRSYDYDGGGVDFAEDNLDPDLPTHFNTANEWILRNVTTGGSDAAPLYDDNGNMTDDDEDYVYKYDPWNRLVSISTTGGSPTLVAEYRYNGLGQRISEGDGTDEEFLIYDDSWRLISRYDDSTSKYIEEILYHHAGLDGYGGSSSLDSVILRRTFLTTGSPRQTEDDRWYTLQNWRNDPVVTVTDAGVQLERVHFSPYGEPFGIPSGDTDFNGEASLSEEFLISSWESIPLAYKAYADIDLDGDIDSDDATSASGETMGRGVLSYVGSKVGYAGYTQDAYVPSVSHVRFRVYKTDLGRWLQRDPAGYFDGLNQYQYVRGIPVSFVDPYGLQSLTSIYFDHDEHGAEYEWELLCTNPNTGEQWTWKKESDFGRVDDIIHTITVLVRGGARVQYFRISTHHYDVFVSEEVGTVKMFWSKNDKSDAVTDAEFLNAMVLTDDAKVELQACRTDETAELILEANPNVTGVTVRSTRGENAHHPGWGIDFTFINPDGDKEKDKSDKDKDGGLLDEIDAPSCGPPDLGLLPDYLVPLPTPPEPGTLPRLPGDPFPFEPTYAGSGSNQ